MPKLLIQCQGSPGPLSFIAGPGYAATILQQYRRVPEQTVIRVPIDDESYYINLALVSWICVTDESKAEPDYTPAGTGLGQETPNTISNTIQDVRDNIAHRQHETNPKPSHDPPEI